MHDVPSTVRFAENNENAEAGSIFVRRKKIEHRPGSGRSTATRDYRFDRPLKYHPLQNLDANIEENDQGVSDDDSGDFGGFAPDFGDETVLKRNLRIWRVNCERKPTQRIQASS